MQSMCRPRSDLQRHEVNRLQEQRRDDRHRPSVAAVPCGSAVRRRIGMGALHARASGSCTIGPARGLPNSLGNCRAAGRRRAGAVTTDWRRWLQPLLPRSRGRPVSLWVGEHRLGPGEGAIGQARKPLTSGSRQGMRSLMLPTPRRCPAPPLSSPDCLGTPQASRDRAAEPCTPASPAAAAPEWQLWTSSSRSTPASPSRRGRCVSGGGDGGEPSASPQHAKEAPCPRQRLPVITAGRLRRREAHRPPPPPPPLPACRPPPHRPPPAPARPLLPRPAAAGVRAGWLR